MHSIEIEVFIFYFAELTNDFSWYEKETIIRWLSWTPTEPIRLNNLGTNYTMKTQYKQEEGFPSGFFPFLLDFRCLVTSIFSLSLSCFGSAVDLEKVLEFIATIWILFWTSVVSLRQFSVSLSVSLWICSRSRKCFRDSESIWSGWEPDIPLASKHELCE